jgi:glycosyltransferase involved in cell wall biosynthesis
MKDSLPHVGLVAIGRNEGERLSRCLVSALKQTSLVIYVDSGSTDNSLAIARDLGVDIVQLDLSIPFTAARARNSGFERLLEIAPDVEYVQFVDGDCEINLEWIKRAVEFISSKTSIAVVCGRRREKFPDHSIYNLLCDIEWNTPIGEAKACGGDALMRVDAFKEVNGFSSHIIAGEEPELCQRMRRRGWKIWRIDAEMTLHDANIERFHQWWRRTVRAGHAYTENAFAHGGGGEMHRVRETIGIFTWGFLLPIAALSLSLFNIYFLIILLLYPIQLVRLILNGNKFYYAFFVILGKFPEFIGQIKFLVHKISGATGDIIEYK